MCPISHFWQCREKLRVSDFLDYGQFLKAPARLCDCCILTYTTCDKKIDCNGSRVKKEITNAGCVKY